MERPGLDIIVALRKDATTTPVLVLLARHHQQRKTDSPLGSRDCESSRAT
jgi:DNA-binding response OmpR family regulator